MNQDEQQMWGSHLPAIMACLAVTNGDVLEIGIGNFSTPILHAFCVSSGRDLISIEKSSDWYNKFTYLKHNHHDLFTDWISNTNDKKRYSVVFIDDSPGGENRATSFRTYIDQSEFVIVHDFWRENEEAIRPLLVGCLFHICRHQEPPTLVCSKSRTIPEGILAL